MAIQGFSTFSANAQTYIAAQTLKRIKRDVVVYNLGKKEKLPNRYSKTFQYTRFEKLDLPYAALTEGTTPDNSSMSISTVSCVMDQWGSYINLTDVAVITAKHPALQAGIELLGEQASETIDRECIKLLLSNTNVTYGGSGATSRATLDASDVMTTGTVKAAVAGLRNQGAHGTSGRLFIGLIDPSVEMDLLGDSTFQNAASYSNIVALYNGEAGTWMGVRWMVSNLLPTMGLLASTTNAGANLGSLANSTAYDFKVTKVSNQTGFEVECTAKMDVSTGAADESVNLTMPATTGYTYNVYAGADGGVLYLYSSQNAPGAVVNVASIPTSGNVAPAQPASGVVVHYAWILGKEAFAVPELMSLETTLTPDVASDSDPLKQRRKAGWKVMFKPVICNENYIERIECASAY